MLSRVHLAFHARIQDFRQGGGGGGGAGAGAGQSDKKKALTTFFFFFGPRLILLKSKG